MPRLTRITRNTKQHLWPVGERVLRCTLREARQLVSTQQQFMGSNIFGAWLAQRIESYVSWDGPRNRVTTAVPEGEKGFAYIVYSYGMHWPLYVWDVETAKWFGNCETYSRTTSKHASMLCPIPREQITWVSKAALMLIGDWGVVHTVMWYAANGHKLVQK